MLKLRLCALFVLALNLVCGHAQTIEKMSLNDAISYALSHVNSLKVSQLNVKDASLAYDENHATALPQVGADFNFQYFYKTPTQLIPDFISPAVYGALKNVTYSNGKALELPINQGGNGYFQSSFVQPVTTNLTLSVNQLLFSGSYTVALKAAKANEKYVQAQLASKQLDVKNMVIDAYLPSLLLVENIKTLDQNIDNLQKTLRDVKASFNAGLVEQLDVDRLQLSLSNLQTERENVDRQRGTLINVLKLTINYPYEQPLEISDDINKLLTATPEAVLTADLDLNGRPEIQVFDNLLRLNEINVELQRSANLPTIAAFANYQYGYTGSFSSLTAVPQGLAGLKASITLWDSGIRKTKIERAQLQLQQIQYQKADVERGLSLQVLNARINYQNAKRRAASQEKNLALAQKIYDTTQTKYKNGVGSSLEVTTAEQALYTSQANLRQAQYDLLASEAAIQKALGR